MKRSGTITSAALLATLAANSGWTGTPERFAGEQRLQAAVLHHRTDIELPLLLLDEVRPTGRHGRFVTNAALKWGVPQPVVHTAPLASVEPNRYAIIVQAHSGASALDSSDVDQLLKTGAIIVAAAGNIGQGNAQGAESTTRYLTPSHDHWKGPQGRAWWQRAVNLMEQGRLIVARASTLQADGWDPDTSVHCGATARWCYTVQASPQGLGEGSTSKAATLLGSLLTFLTALGPAPVSLLKACAKDIGPPGVDPVFGQGLAAADCPELIRLLESRER